MTEGSNRIRRILRIIWYRRDAVVCEPTVVSVLLFNYKKTRDAEWRSPLLCEYQIIR